MYVLVRSPMDALRREVNEAEARPSRIEEILRTSSDTNGFISLYLKRNPERRHPAFLEFYDTLDVPSQVLLFEDTRKMVKDERFEEECVARYCVERRSEVCFSVIREIRSPRILFRALGRSFLSSVDLGEEEDFFFTRCIVVALGTHEIEPDETDTLISAIGHHFSDGRRKYYEHGAIVASVLLKTNEFGVGSMGEAQRMIEDIPGCVLVEKHKDVFSNPGDAFRQYRKVENDLGVFEGGWKPRYLQEAVRAIVEERDAEKVKTCFKCFPDLVKSATDRTLGAKGKDAFETLLGYDGCEEYKVDAISSLLKRCFEHLAGDALEDLFSTKLCLRRKLVLVFCLKNIVQEGSYEQASLVHRNMEFMLKRVGNNVPKTMESAFGCLFLTGHRRLGRPVNDIEVDAAEELRDDESLIFCRDKAHPLKCMRLD